MSCPIILVIPDPAFDPTFIPDLCYTPTFEALECYPDIFPTNIWYYDITGVHFDDPGLVFS